jgi:hypothetical protein
MALQTLTWVYYAREPLRIEQLVRALVIEEGDSDQRPDVIDAVTIFDCCLSFLTDDYGKISFIHPSVHRWFGNGPQHGKLLSEGYLAKTCLTYLNFDVFEEIKTLDIMRSPEKYFFANYAFQFWEDHTRNVEEEVEVQELAFHFLQIDEEKELDNEHDTGILV